MPDRPLLRVIVYDIADNRRRRKVAGALEEMAARVQESVFEARLSAAQLGRLRRRMTALTTMDDSVRFYTIPDAALPRCHVDGGPLIADGARYWLF